MALGDLVPARGAGPHAPGTGPAIDEAIGVPRRRHPAAALRALPAAGRHRRLSRHGGRGGGHRLASRIAALYGELLEMVPSPIVELNRAVAVAMADGPEAGLALVDALEASGALAGLPPSPGHPGRPAAAARSSRPTPPAPIAMRSNWRPTTPSAATWPADWRRPVGTPDPQSTSAGV